MNLALVGNPNSGKTTLFNRLTGLQKRVGNFPGVTVERVQGTLRTDASVLLTDLPGVYSLALAEGEETLAREALRDQPPDAVLNVLDATTMPRGLFLTLELLETGLPVIVALTMLDELASGGGAVDVPALSRALGVPVVRADACPDALAKLLPPPTATAAQPARSAAERYARADQICAQAVRSASEPAARVRSRRADRWLLHPVFAFPIFLGVMALILYLTFGPVGGGLGAVFGAAVSAAFSALDRLLVLAAAPSWLRGLLSQGVFNGLGAVLGFLPTVLTLFFLLSLVEDSGYMARMACCADRVLRRLGVSGRAFAPLLLGFGCTVPALLAVRTLPQTRERRFTAMLLPFCSCSAKLPVYALFASAFFPGHEILCVAALYSLGVLLMLPAAFVLRRLGPPAPPSPLRLELPSYRMPSPRAALALMLLRTRAFLRCALTTLLPASIVVWLLGSINIGGVSALERAASALSPAFVPVGFADWRAVAALLTGLAAKEGILSTFGVLLQAPGAFALRAALRRLFTPLSACSFLTFVLLYTPCAATLAAARRELGGVRAALTLAAAQAAIAYLAACAVYNVGRLCGFA